MTRLLAVLVVAGLLLPSFAPAQRVPDPVLAYRDAVRVLRAGRPAQAVLDVLGHESGWLTETVRRVCLAVRSRDARLEPLDIQAAVLLHLEIFRLPGALPSDRDRNLGAIRDLAAAARGGLPKTFLRQCQLAVVLTLQKHLLIEDLVEQLGAALAQFPDDAELLLAKGSLWELLAAVDDPNPSYVPNEAIREIASTGHAPLGTFFVDVQAPKIYERCARVYEKVLRIAPDLFEARLRLGRAMALTGKFDDAARTLEPLRHAGSNVPDRVTYLALLFHGRAMIGLSRPQDAGASARAALALFPGCQSAQLALSMAARAAGDLAGARELMVGQLSAAAGRACQNDPWWDYLPGEARRLDSLLVNLEASVRQ